MTELELLLSFFEVNAKTIANSKMIPDVFINLGFFLNSQVRVVSHFTAIRKKGHTGRNRVAVIKRLLASIAFL